MKFSSEECTEEDPIEIEDTGSEEDNEEEEKPLSFDDDEEQGTSSEFVFF